MILSLGDATAVTNLFNIELTDVFRQSNVEVYQKSRKSVKTF